ncbi:MAG: AAA family ATPase [Eubacteriales bacterium]|nr:AAA family ATPase [Eubacteriales bacterium]
MILKRLTIKRFGKICHKTLELSPGINVLYGENESGKTTLHTFIHSMLFGITRQRGRGAKNDIYARYEPWESPADYGGSLWFECQGKEYRLTRTFYKENQSAQLFCQEEGRLLEMDEDLERLLGKVSQAVYDNTVSVGQLKSVAGPELARELQNYMASYQGTGDCSVDLGRAMQMLKMTRKGYRDQKEKGKREREKEQEKLQAKMEYLKGEMEELTKKQSALSQKEAGLRGKPGQETGESLMEDTLDRLRAKKAGLLAASLLGVLLGIAGLVFRPGAADQLSRLGWDFCMVLSVGAVCFFLSALRRVQRDLGRQRKLMIRWNAQQEKLRWNRDAIEETCQEKRMDFSNLMEEYQDYENESLLPSGEDREIQAIELAMATIEDISGNMQRRAGRRLRSRTSRILKEITGGRYQDVVMDEELHMTVNTQERTIPVERLSRGTLEQVYFALRMAAADLFCGGEAFPVILDDVFGMYDEERLASVLHWLEKEEKQVIISTCSKRELELLDREGIPYRRLEL